MPPAVPPSVPSFFAISYGHHAWASTPGMLCYAQRVRNRKMTGPFVFVLWTDLGVKGQAWSRQKRGACVNMHPGSGPWNQKLLLKKTTLYVYIQSECFVVCLSGNGFYKWQTLSIALSGNNAIRIFSCFCMLGASITVKKHTALPG